MYTQPSTWSVSGMVSQWIVYCLMSAVLHIASQGLIYKVLVTVLSNESHYYIRAYISKFSNASVTIGGFKQPVIA